MIAGFIGAGLFVVVAIFALWVLYEYAKGMSDDVGDK